MFVETPTYINRLLDHTGFLKFKNIFSYRKCKMRDEGCLQKTKKQIAGEFSIPQIAYSVREVQELYEDALIAIEDEFRNDDDPAPPPKETKSIKISNLNKKAHLNSEEDVNVFIEAVRSELLKAIHGNYRVRVQ